MKDIVMWESGHGNIRVTYKPESMGDKYAIRRKIYFEQLDGSEPQPMWTLDSCFASCYQAVVYAKKMHDGDVYR